MDTSFLESLASHWQSRMSGLLLTPAHPDFSSATKLWNGMIERTPALIAQCTCADDVSTVIALAKAESLPVSVRGRGHNVAGKAEGQVRPGQSLSAESQHSSAGLRLAAAAIFIQTCIKIAARVRCTMNPIYKEDAYDGNCGFDQAIR